MRKRDSDKAAHERRVADQLLAALGAEATFERRGDPNKNEPDVICRKADGQVIAIEVVTAYYEDSDARDAAEIAAGENPFGPDEIMRERSAGPLGGPDQKICESIQNELDKKCRKTYAGPHEKWLCINPDALLSDAASIAECVKNLKVPVKHEFARIYLHEEGKYPPVQIF